MKCRKCGHENEAGQWVCLRCEYILDPSFLGSDILNERTRDGLDDEPPLPLPAEEDFGGDALILGRLGERDIVEPFVTDRARDFLSASGSHAPAAVYVTAEIRNLLLPDRVLRPTADARARLDMISDFERALFELIDGARRLEDVQQAAGLSDHDLCVAVAMLHDKALVERVPEGELADHDQKDLDDHTRELDELPPLAMPSSSSTPPRAPPAAARPPVAPKPTKPAALAGPGMPPPFDPPPTSARPTYDDLEMRPLPAPAIARPDSEAMRPALAVRPAMPPRAPAAQKPKAMPSPPSSSASLSSLSSSSSGPVKRAGVVSPAGADEKTARAAGYYEMCLKDLAAGRQSRAWNYARMAAEAEPGNEKYQTLIRDWHKQHSSAHGEKASTPQELMASAQAAENDGDTQAALAFLRRLIATAPNSAAGHNKLAVLLATRAHDFRGAYDAAIKAVELEPSNMAYQSNMMKILARVDSEERVQGDGPRKGGLLDRLLKR